MLVDISAAQQFGKNERTTECNRMIDFRRTGNLNGSTTRDLADRNKRRSMHVIDCSLVTPGSLHCVDNRR